MKFKLILALFVITGFTGAMLGCGSAQIKQRKEQRDKMVQSGKLYCDFVNGEVYSSDVEVQLNLEMAKHCDTDKNYTVSQYKTHNENQGLIYCCVPNASTKASIGKSNKEVKESKEPKEVKESKKDDKISAPKDDKDDE